jgi:hypothetical protein
VDPRQPSRGYGSVVAIRIYAESQFLAPGGFAWGHRRIIANEWNQITG